MTEEESLLAEYLYNLSLYGWCIHEESDGVITKVLAPNKVILQYDEEGSIKSVIELTKEN